MRDINDGNVWDREGVVWIGGEGAREGNWLERGGYSTRVSNVGKDIEELGFSMIVNIGSCKGA